MSERGGGEIDDISLSPSDRPSEAVKQTGRPTDRQAARRAGIDAVFWRRTGSAAAAAAASRQRKTAARAA